MTKLKVGIISEFFPPHLGGCEQRAYEVGSRLRSRGHEVHVFTVRYNRKLAKEDNVNGMLVHRYGFPYESEAKWHRRSLRGVTKYSIMTSLKLMRAKFDVYYFNQFPFTHLIASFPFTSPSVLVWSEVFLTPGALVALEKISKHAPTMHVAISGFTYHRLLDFLSIKPERVKIIPNGVDCHVLFPSEKQRGMITFVGCLVPHKRIDLVIKTFRKCKKTLGNLELHIVGDGPLLQNLENLRINGLHVHGALSEDEKNKLLRKTWVFLMPSIREGFGKAALEAMAAGCPVITVNASDNATKEFVAAGKGGLVVDINEEAIAQALIELYQNQDLWKQLSNNAVNYAAGFDWNHIVDLTEKLFEDLVGTI